MYTVPFKDLKEQLWFSKESIQEVDYLDILYKYPIIKKKLNQNIEKIKTLQQINKEIKKLESFEY